jgi:hypothetical protein
MTGTSRRPLQTVTISAIASLSFWTFLYTTRAPSFS